MSMKEKFNQEFTYHLETFKKKWKEDISFRQLIQTLLFFCLLTTFALGQYASEASFYREFKKHAEQFYILELYFESNFTHAKSNIIARKMSHKNGCYLDPVIGDDFISIVFGCYGYYGFVSSKQMEDSNLEEVEENQDVSIR